MMVMCLNMAHKSLSAPLADDQVQPDLFQGMEGQYWVRSKWKIWGRKSSGVLEAR